MIERQPLRLAMFSPVPPTASGIAAYVADLLPLLPNAWRIDLFTDADVAADSTALAHGRETAPPCLAHTEFAARHAAEPYDLIIYQVGNSAAQDWMLDYVLTHPGLLVLHDGVLHPARVTAATQALDLHRYRRALRACRPDVGNAIGHLVAGGLGGPALYFTFPMCEDLVRASRLTAMHGEESCDWLRRLVPEARIEPLVHWRAVEVDEARRAAWRERLAGDGAVLIGSFGNIGAERRLNRVLRALARLDQQTRAEKPDAPAARIDRLRPGSARPEAAPRWRIVIAGRVDDRLKLPALAERLGIADRVTWQPGLDDADFIALMAATDFAINLRYPSARASSGVLHQLLQLGVPALVSDVVHGRDYPEDTVAYIPPGPDGKEAAALRNALHDWIDDAAARHAAGRAARRWADRHLTPARMRAGYVGAVAEALSRMA